MPRIAPFESHHQRYEAWFDQHEAAYVSELLALRPFVPWEGTGIEIGVGSGRFAAPLGIRVGVDPSPAMLVYAAARGIAVVQGVAENLPFADASFDHALVMTTLCFVDSPEQMLAESHRVLKPGGRLVIGFVDRERLIGRHYLTHQRESDFYRSATFYTSDEVEQLLIKCGFAVHSWGQTLFAPLSEIRTIEPLRAGRGKGAFVVVAASKGDDKGKG